MIDKILSGQLDGGALSATRLLHEGANGGAQRVPRAGNLFAILVISRFVDAREALDPYYHVAQVFRRGGVGVTVEAAGWVASAVDTKGCDVLGVAGCDDQRTEEFGIRKGQHVGWIVIEK